MVTIFETKLNWSIGTIINLVNASVLKCTAGILVLEMGYHEMNRVSYLGGLGNHGGTQSTRV